MYVKMLAFMLYAFYQNKNIYLEQLFMPIHIRSYLLFYKAGLPICCGVDVP